MASFDIAKLQHGVLGPAGKLWIYNITTAFTGQSYTHFNTTEAPGLSAGDVILLCHNTNAALAVLRITAIDATSSTYVSAVAS